MSSSGFDTLRHDHKEFAQLISRMEQLLAETIRQDPEALIDGEILSQRLTAERKMILQLLLQLVNQHDLRRVYLWRCPSGFGTVDEAEDLAALPDSIECDRCGSIHYFNQDDIEVQFLPTETLREALLTR